MTDDIVTRLRGKEHGDNENRCESCDEFCCHCELCDCCLEILEVCLVAADEIERLRAVSKWLAEELQAQLSPWHRDTRRSHAVKALENYYGVGDEQAEG